MLPRKMISSSETSGIKTFPQSIANNFSIANPLKIEKNNAETSFGKL
jgi:hypothetical protein